MYADYGFYLLFLSLISSIYGTLAALVAAKLHHRKLFLSAKMAATATFIMVLTAAILLWIMLYQRDYSVAYIFRNSSNDLPAFYTFSAFWSALEGSHFLWTLLLAFFSLLAHWTYSKDNEHIMPYVSVAIQSIAIWMLYLAVSYSDPFLLQYPVAENGRGMNALLQNYYMAIHPPTLFTGYTAMVVPFAYSIAALFYGDITEGWLRTVRRWSLFAWIALTVGIVLGGRWAYVELGWAGYWAWDPVENSSFMPWLFVTALLHALLVQDKTGHLKRLSVVLAVVGFFFCYFGTFITRSGIISSVHSFAQSPIGPNYLAFLGIYLLLFMILYAIRAPLLIPTETTKAWGFSRESVLLVTQFLILTFAVIIFIGTVYPIVSEALTGNRFNIQAPYFNSFAPYIGVAFIVALGIGNLVRYNSGKMVGGKKLQIYASIGAVIFTILFGKYGRIFETPDSFGMGAQIVGSWLVGWAAICLSYDIYYKFKLLKFNSKLFFDRNLSTFGAYVAHIGFLIAILGFLGNYRGIEKDVTLTSGRTTELYGYEFRFDGVKVEQKHNVIHYVAPLKITKNGQVFGTLRPARSKYVTKPELLHEVGLMSTLMYDIYGVLSDFDNQTGLRATFELYINPTVRFVWISCVIMALGGLISLFDKRRGVHSRDVTYNTWEVS